MTRRHAARRLTPRDLTVLHWIGQAGIAALDQVARFGWAGRRVYSVQDRLNQLVKAGYLQSTTCDARQPGEQVYALTQAGWRLFTPQEREQLRIGLPAVKERKQQLLAQEAYLRLAAEARAAGGMLVAWRSERDLRGEVRRGQQATAHAPDSPVADEIADGQAVIATADGTTQEVDVEIDGQYYGRMLRQKAAAFGQGGRPTIWVCTANRARAVQQATRPYANIRVLVV